MRYLLSLSLVVLMAGCAAMRESEAAHKEKLLIAAGFQQRVASTPQKQKLLASMEPYKMQARTKNGATYYVYPDPDQNSVFVGNSAQYQAYRKMAYAQQRKEQEQITATQMSAMEWGYWGGDPMFGGIPTDPAILYH